MNTPESDRRVCEQCGALLSHHTRDGLCSRCLARFSLLEAEDGKEEAEGGGEKAEIGGQRSEAKGLRFV